jgi:hypothetical protein
MSYRLLFCLLWASGVCCVLGWFWFGLEVIPNSPRLPDVEHTVPIAEHGETVYVTPGEDKARYIYLFSAMASGLAAEWLRKRCNFNFRRDELN